MAEIMTEGQLRQAKIFIRRLCANFDNGRCLILDSSCPQCFSYTLLCNYFKEAVLPDRDCRALQAEILQEPCARRCVVCGKTLQAKSNRAKYCPRCGLVMRRKRQAGYERQRRGKRV